MSNSVTSNSDVLSFENLLHNLPRNINSNMPSTFQSDLFAVGLTLYKVITGKRPYKGRSDNTIRTFLNVTGYCMDISLQAASSSMLDDT